MRFQTAIIGVAILTAILISCSSPEPKPRTSESIPEDDLCDELEPLLSTLIEYRPEVYYGIHDISYNEAAQEEINNLGEQGLIIDSLVKCYQQGNTEMQREVLTALCNLPSEPTALNCMIDALGNEDRIVGELAVWAISCPEEYGDDEKVNDHDKYWTSVRSALGQAAEDESIIRRINAIFALGVISEIRLRVISGTEEWHSDMLTGLLYDNDPEIRFLAARALPYTNLSIDEATPRIIEMLKTESDTGIVISAFQYLQCYGPRAESCFLEGRYPEYLDCAREAVPVVLDYLESDSIALRLKAAGFLAQIGKGTEDAVSALMQLWDGQASVRFQITRMIHLFCRDGVAATPLLANRLRELNDIDPQERIFSEDIERLDIALAFLHMGENVDEAGQVLVDWEETWRLQELGLNDWLTLVQYDSSYLMFMISLMDEDEPYLLVNIMEALGGIGPDASAALPRLRELSNSDSEYIAELAAEMIEKIENRE